MVTSVFNRCSFQTREQTAVLVLFSSHYRQCVTSGTPLTICMWYQSHHDESGLWCHVSHANQLVTSVMPSTIWVWCQSHHQQSRCDVSPMSDVSHAISNLSAMPVMPSTNCVMSVTQSIICMSWQLRYLPPVYHECIECLSWPNVCYFSCLFDVT